MNETKECPVCGSNAHLRHVDMSIYEWVCSICAWNSADDEDPCSEDHAMWLLLRTKDEP